MERIREHFGFKSLLYCSAAALALTISASAQERMPSQTQDRPAATNSGSTSQPSAQQDRSQRVQDRSEKGTTGQATPPRSGAETESDQPRTQNRDAQSPADSKSQQQRSQSNETERSRGNQQKQSRDGDRSRDKQQTQSRDSERTQQRNQSAAPDRQRNQDNAQSPQNRGGETRDSARSGDSNRQAAQPTEQQRTRISTSIRQANVEPVRNVNFSVSVGATVPASVRLHRVTPAIVEVYPRYRDYSFAVVDESIVIIEPRTKKIVTVIDHGGGARTGSVSRSKLKLSDQQRDVIRRSATERRTTGSGSGTTTMEREITIGEELPETVEIESFPDTIYTEVPEIRSYRYIVRDEDVYLVDPAERRVIEVIR